MENNDLDLCYRDIAKEAVGGLLLYDLSRFSTTRQIPEWFNIWKDNAPEGAPLFLIGSKADLVPENDLPAAEEALAGLATDLKVSKYFVVSSKSGKNINILLNDLMNESYLFNLHLLESFGDQTPPKCE